MIKEYLLANKRALLFFLFIPIYMAAFFLIEKLIPNSADYWSSYIPLDDKIPFVEVFVIFYCIWYLFIIIPGVYVFFKDISQFKLYIWYFILSYSVCFIIFILLPNGQDLRPEVFPRDNMFTDLVALLYSSDTNTNVFPSMHVTGTLGALTLFFNNDFLKKFRWFALVLSILICLSTLFIKQHSILDVIAAIAVWAFSYMLIYKRFYLKKRSSSK